MRPISRKQFDDIRRWLADDESSLSREEIAERAGVSTRTVYYIACGKISRPPGEAEIPVPPGPRLHDGEEFQLVEPYRCPRCGHYVTLLPCLICHERSKRESLKIRSLANG